MARSSYIYLVTILGKPYAAFTVKHELESSLPKNGDGVEVYRIRDNDTDQTPTNITEEFYE